jgi:hypothetical protein
MIRKNMSETLRNHLFNLYDYTCVYCGGFATQIDHIKPYSWDADDSEENLVPCCQDCNLIASDKIFKTFIDKKNYIQDKLKLPKWKRKRLALISLCTECGAIFTPRKDGSSVFLCANCHKKNGGAIK